MDFQDNVRKFREAAGYTAKDFAALIGIKYSTYVSYEAAGKEPKYDTLRKIAAALGVSIDKLLDFEVSREENNISLCRKMGVKASKENDCIDLPDYGLQVSPDSFSAFAEYAKEKALQSAAPHFQTLIETDFDYFLTIQKLLNKKGFQVPAEKLAGRFDEIKKARRKGELSGLSAAALAKKVMDILNS